MADEINTTITPKAKNRKLGIGGIKANASPEELRRYCREKMRIYRAEARAKRGPYIAGTRKGQRHGKDTLPDDVRAGLAQMPSESDAEWKLRYARASNKRWRERHPEGAKTARIKSQSTDAYKAKKLAWREANKEKVVAYYRADFERNREKKLSNLREWGRKNPEKWKAAQIIWKAANKHVFTASHAKIRAKAAQATPPWVDWKEIEKVYAKAKRLTKKTGIEHQVDHIVPLNGKNIRGLHVPWNLQVLTKTENIAKSNKFDPSLL